MLEELIIIHLVMKLCLHDIKMFFSLNTCSCCWVSTMCCEHRVRVKKMQEMRRQQLLISNHDTFHLCCLFQSWPVQANQIIKLLPAFSNTSEQMQCLAGCDTAKQWWTSLTSLTFWTSWTVTLTISTLPKPPTPRVAITSRSSKVMSMYLRHHVGQS